MAVEKAKLLCSFGGDFINQQGRAFYVGGKTRLVSIERSASFRYLLSKMSELCNADPNSLEVRFQLTDGSLDFRLVSVETDDDVFNMMEEFDPGRKIPVFLFTDKTRNAGIAPGGHAPETSTPTLMIDAIRETLVEERIECQSVPNDVFGRDYIVDQPVGPGVSGEILQRGSHWLVVGQEYEDVLTCRNALTSAAIADNFELHMIRSDQRRVTARCAAQGCTWRVHASKLPHVSTFRIRTLTTEHSCIRSEDARHRQATAKWIANCIRDKLRQNPSYKPREILNDIHRDYGVLITYKRAFLGKEKALEELRTEPTREMFPVENYEPIMDNNQQDGALVCGEIHDPPRKKRVNKACQHQDIRPLHCTWCNQIGHNRRTCIMSEPYPGRDSAQLLPLVYIVFSLTLLPSFTGATD